MIMIIIIIGIKTHIHQRYKKYQLNKMNVNRIMNKSITKFPKLVLLTKYKQ